MKKNKKKYIILLLLFIAVGMGIGYSLLQQQLKIQGTATVDQNYSVEITGIEKMFSGLTDHYNLRTNTYDAIGAGVYDQELPTSTESYTANTAVFNINFKGADTIVLYKVKIENKGNIDAKISNVSISKTGDDTIKVKQLTDLNNLVLEPLGEAFYMFTVELPEGAKVDSENLTTEITITIDTEQYVSSSSSNDVFIQNPYIYFGATVGNEDDDVFVAINAVSASNDCKLMISVNGAAAVESGPFNVYTKNLFKFYDGATNSTVYNSGDKLDMYIVCTRTSNISSKKVSAESNHITFNYASNTGD